jgi:hypothetical protein
VGDAGDAVKNEVQVHLKALKSYTDMKFDTLKGMLSGKKQKEETTSKLEELQSTMQSAMTNMEKL